MTANPRSPSRSSNQPAGKSPAVEPHPAVTTGLRNPSGPLAWLAYSAPFVAAVVFVARYGANVPIVDQWGLVGLFEAVAKHTGVVAELLKRNNEHAVLFPKLIWIALAFTTKWNVRVDLFATLVPMIAMFLAFAWIILNERPRGAGCPPRDGWPMLLSLAVSSLLLFSLVHSDTYLGGFQLSFTLTNAAVIAAIWSLSASRAKPLRGVILARPLRGLILAWLSCIVASFSSLHGMLAWIVILPCLFTLFETRRERLAAVCGTGLLAAASVAVYSFAFTPGNKVADPSFWYKHPITVAKFFLTVLGLPLMVRNGSVAERFAGIVGAAVLGVFLAGAYWAVRRARWPMAAPWISIGLFGLGFAGMVSIGRTSWGLSGAVGANRYTICTILVTIAAVQLWRQALADQPIHRRAFLALALLVGAASVAASVTTIPQARELAQGRRHAAECLPFVDYIAPQTDGHWEGCLFPLMPIAEYVHFMRAQAEILDSLGWLKLVKHVRFIDQPAESYGSMDSAPTPQVVGPNDWIYCSGWAIIGSEHRLPNAVLVSAGDERQFIGEAPVGTILRPGVAASLHWDAAASGWSVWIPAKFLPPGSSELVAWAFDDRKQEYVRLNGGKPYRQVMP